MRFIAFRLRVRRVITFVGVAVAVGVTATPRPANALQPLQTFVASARQFSPDNLEAQGNLTQAQGQARSSLGRALPGFTARATYTRNQFAVTFDLPLGADVPPVALTIQPLDQLDGYLTLNVPLVDLASFQRIASASSSADSAAKQAAATQLQVESQVVQGYYQLVANLALVSASERALDVARTGATLTTDRFNAGSAAQLDVDRAQAEVERQVQQLTSAQLQRDLAIRALESLSGLTPDVQTSLELRDDLHPEDPLATFQTADSSIPSLAATIQARQALEQQASAQRLVLVPSLTASATEHYTNATGFTGGHSLIWNAQANLNWAIDFTTFANIKAADAGAEIARARESRARLAAHDLIHRTWNTVQANIARSRSARAQAAVSREAAVLAQDRYGVGATTQLDLLQAQRDAFAADVTQIQADADLVNARAQLRFAAGKNFDAFMQESRP